MDTNLLFGISSQELTDDIK